MMPALPDLWHTWPDKGELSSGFASLVPAVEAIAEHAERVHEHSTPTTSRLQDIIKSSLANQHQQIRISAHLH